jgi:protoporphyrinogen oxidase
MRIAVIGGGIAGLTAGYELGKQGHKVTILERSSELGGQAGTFAVGGTRLERFYHHLFTSDRHIVGLIDELGLADRLTWIPSKVGFFYGGRVYDFVTPGDLLRFSPLSLVDRLRAGLVSLYLQRQSNGLQYEQITAANWIRRFAGPEVYRVIWHPLLRGKFGQRAEEVSMTWFWGKMRLRFGSRKGLGRESLGYMKGSFQLLIDELAKRIQEQGGQIVTGRAAERIVVEDGRAVGVQLAGRDDPEPADVVIATVPSFVFARLAPEISGDYAERLNAVQYQAALVLVLQIRQTLSRIYWLNVSDPQVPFVAAIEQTNFVPPEVYGGRRLLYLSNYLDPSSPLLAASRDEVITTYLPGLQRINPALDASWIQDSWLFRDDAGQPVVTRGYSRIIPPYQTPIAHLYLANTTQIYPEDRGMNYSVRLGQDIARIVHNAGQ